MKTVILACKKRLLYVFFLFLPLCLFAQTGNREMVAVVPFWGVNETIQVEFASEVMDGINRLAGYRSSLIDMTNIPEDVPEGGYEPNVCPSPSLIRGLPFAMTGEISEDFDTGGWALRVYLWRMEGTRLIYSDRLVADDRNTCRLILPGLLDWIFSFLKEPDSPFVLGGAGGAGGDGMGGGGEKTIYYTPEEPNHWLFIGLRGGGAMKILLDPAWDKGLIPYKDPPEAAYDDTIEPKSKIPYLSPMTTVNAAFTFAWMFPDNALFASPFGLQLEVIFNWDLSDDFNSKSLAFAGSLRTHLYRKGTTTITLLTGGYYALPPFDEQVENVTTTLKPEAGGWGLTGGLSIGNKLGAGYLYLELRWMGDIFVDTYRKTTIEGKQFDLGFQRHLAGLCIGYEFGIINKNKK